MLQTVMTVLGLNQLSAAICASICARLLRMFLLFVLQEEIEAQMKADKIKLALEKLKEAKVKKVRPPRRGRASLRRFNRNEPDETKTADTKTLERPKVQKC